MSRHIALDLLIIGLVILGLLIDGLDVSDFFFCVATVIWVMQKELEDLLK